QPITSCQPEAPIEPQSMLLDRLLDSKSPVMYGRKMMTASGISRHAPVTYPVHTAGRTPNTFATQIPRMMIAPIQIAGLASKLIPRISSLCVVPQVASDQNSPISRPPTITELRARTTDQPSQ